MTISPYPTGGSDREITKWANSVQTDTNTGSGDVLEIKAAPFIVVGNSDILSNERRLVGAGGEVLLTDAGAGSTLTVSIIEIAQAKVTGLAAALTAKVDTTRQIIAGTGLDGTASLAADVTLDLADTAVSAASYGSATAIPVFTVDAQGRMTAASTAAIPILDHGTYTPTLTGVTNVDSTSGSVCQYMRVGNTVTVSGAIDVDATADTTFTEVGISLPIASTLTDSSQCCGTISATTITQFGSIIGDASNGRAQANFVSASAANQALTFTFTYRIL